MDSLTRRLERLEQARPPQAPALLSFPTEDAAREYLAEAAEHGDDLSHTRVYIGVDLERV